MDATYGKEPEAIIIEIEQRRVDNTNKDKRCVNVAISLINFIRVTEFVLSVNTLLI